ncbi:MAG: hypothetical protein ACYC60_20235, partial [Thermoanaerobaculia bacterium]
MRLSVRHVVMLLLLILAIGRVALQLSVMPAYAGLDELFHVARIAFQAREHRSPSISELSISRDLLAVQLGEPGFPASFAAHGPRALSSSSMSRAISATERGDYRHLNYQAQQPSLYYMLAAAVHRIVQPRTLRAELLLLRVMSSVFAVIVIMLIGITASRLVGPSGALAAALLCLTPTWQTLTIRVSNDALVCLLIAVGVLTAGIDARPASWLIEGSSWSLAIATKLYAGPAMIFGVVAALSRRSWLRVGLIVGCTSAVGLPTLMDLGNRTPSVVGLQQYSLAHKAIEGGRVSYIESLKVFVATAAWPA